MGASNPSRSCYRDALTLHVSPQILHQLQLLVDGEPANDHLQDRTHGNVVFTNETAIINVSKHAHEESSDGISNMTKRIGDQELTGSPFDRSSHHDQGCCGQNP